MLMKNWYKNLRFLVIIPLLVLLAGKASAQVTYDWNGSLSVQWNTSANWSVNGVVQTTSYPGDPLRSGSNTDIVQFGVNIFFGYNPGYPTGATNYHPILPATDNITIASVIIGDNSNTNDVETDIFLDFEGTLNVTGTILQMHSNNIGLPGIVGSLPYPTPYYYHIQTRFFGAGNVNCANFQVGDNTVPPVAGVSNVTRFNIGDGQNDGIGLNIVVTGNFIVNTATYNDPTSGAILAVSNADVSVNGGSITIGNQLRLQNYGEINWGTNYAYQPQAIFVTSIRNNNANTIINLQGAHALWIQPQDPISHQYAGDNIVFYGLGNNPVNQTGNNPGVDAPLGRTTVIYSGNVDQEVYTASSFGSNYLFLSNGGNYNYLQFSGSGRKIIDATPSASFPLIISGDITLGPGTETVDLTTNNPTIVLNNGSNIVYNAHGQNTYLLPSSLYTIPNVSNFTTSANTTFQNGSKTLTLPGNVVNGGTFNTSTDTVNIAGQYTNTGTFKQTGGTVNFTQPTAQSLTDNSTGGTTFSNVYMKNGGTITMSGSGSGQFYIAHNGFLHMANSTTLNANGFLTVSSDATGSGTVTAIPTGCSINGNVTVQRYVSANRGYRLLSSPVYVGNDGTNNYSGVNYLLSNTVVTGSGGGFNKSGNPTLYLWRENLVPQYTTFLNSNYVGISDITNPAAYGLSDATYPTEDIPVGNGFLFYYRGSIKQATIGALTTAGAAATTDTLNAVGTLNQGSITVHPWYQGASTNLGWSTTNAGNPLIQGFNLVGNPYASSIDWDKLDTANPTGAIYGPNVTAFSYQLVPVGLPGGGNYNVYMAGSSSKTGSQGVANSNIIASGQGFFVQATSSSASLTFSEAAKTNTVKTGASLLMGKPVANVEPQYLRIQFGMDTLNTDGTVIRFNQNAKSNFDVAEDARYRIGTGKVSLSSLSSDNVAVAYNQLPLALKGDTIHLNVKATTSGTFSFNIKELVGIPQLYNVLLVDAKTNDTTDLRKTQSYSFTINTSDTTTFGAHRFSVVINQNPALQYKLISFNGSQVGTSKHVQLTWSTVNEQNYTHFTVERSNDNGKTFSVAGGLVSTGAGTYALLDNYAYDGDNQYRLKQEDFNNTITYSNIVDVKISSQGSSDHVTIYPNPASSNISISFVPKAVSKTTYNLRISNSAGIVVKYAALSEPSWQGNISNLLTGSYLVQIVDSKDNTIIGQTKFVKL